MSDIIDTTVAPITKPAKPFTAAMVRAILVRRFCAPEWAVLFEVGDATGARHTRFADAVAMSLWPSRGLELWGFEIKVSRYDWRNERAQPQKAETIAAYCDRWFLVTGPGVVDDISEIPPAWGWLECIDARTIVTRRDAGQTEAKPCDRKFLAALLRRASKTDDALVEAAIAERMAIKERDFDQRVLAAAEQRTRLRGDLEKRVADFEEASGLKLTDRDWLAPGATEIGRAVRAITSSGIDATWSGLSALSNNLVEAAQKIDTALVEAGYQLQPKASPTRDRRKRSAT